MLSPMLLDNIPRTVSPIHLSPKKPLDNNSGEVYDINALPSDETWPEILGVLFNLSMSPDGGKRETAYRVFTTTPGIIEKQHESAVLEAFGRGFKDDAVGVSTHTPFPPKTHGARLHAFHIGAAGGNGSIRFLLP